MKAALRRLVHRGSVNAAGLFADTRQLGEAAARERLLPFAGRGSAVFRFGPLLVIELATPARLHASRSPAGLLVRYGEALSSAPLSPDELACLNIAGPTLVLVRGGELSMHSLGPASLEDPATWIDVSDFEVAGEARPLGEVVSVPAAAALPVEVDLRAEVGIGAPPPEAERALAALRGDGVRPSVLRGLAARLLGGFVDWLDRLTAILDRPGGTARRGPAALGPGKGAWREDRPRQGRSWLSRIAGGLHAATLRVLVWSGLAPLVGRRQARYFNRVLEMFESGDLDSALRHAIPLGGEGGAADRIELGTPSPRTDLAIVPDRAQASSTMLSTGDIFAELRQRYRRAFEILSGKGQIEKAAFVLAELLQANEEAVSFLEKHGRMRLAAEIAEARRLPPGLVVRLWFLAGDRDRAIRLARAQGAFGDAVHRLETWGDPEEAAALRLLWADHLASAGNHGAAVDVLWPVEPARALAARWLDLAIAAGGPGAARMAVKKVRLFPESFGEVRDITLKLLGEDGEDGLAIARAFAAEIGGAPGEAALRTLAKPVTRALARSPEPSDARLLSQAAEATGDSAFRADVNSLQHAPPPPRPDGGPSSSESGRPEPNGGRARRWPSPSHRVPEKQHSLRARSEPLLIHRPAETAGALRVFDAAELPDGRILVALGELGAWLLSREGRMITRFSEPAERIVMSDHGDRAIGVARRGETLRLTRLDLARKRQQPWCDVEAEAFAPDFDGSVWYVARGGTVFAVDATAGGWQHLWQVHQAETRVGAIARDAAVLSIFFLGDTKGRERVWTYELPSHTLRKSGFLRAIEGHDPLWRWLRSALSPKGTVLTPGEEGGLKRLLHVRIGDAASTLELPRKLEIEVEVTDEWMVARFADQEGAGVYLFDMAGHKERARVTLAGPGNRVWARLGRRLLVFDDRGRLLVISLETGSVLRELTLT